MAVTSILHIAIYIRLDIDRSSGKKGSRDVLEMQTETRAEQLNCQAALSQINHRHAWVTTSEGLPLRFHDGTEAARRSSFNHEAGEDRSSAQPEPPTQKHGLDRLL